MSAPPHFRPRYPPTFSPGKNYFFSKKELLFLLERTTFSPGKNYLFYGGN